MNKYNNRIKKNIYEEYLYRSEVIDNDMLWL